MRDAMEGRGDAVVAMISSEFDEFRFQCRSIYFII